MIVDNDCKSNIYPGYRLALKSDQTRKSKDGSGFTDLCFPHEDKQDFMLDYARAYIALHIRPGRLSAAKVLRLCQGSRETLSRASLSIIWGSNRSPSTEAAYMPSRWALNF